MNHAGIFAQQFARLAMLARDPLGATDADLDFAARGAEAMLRTASVVLAPHEWRLLVDGAPIPQALSGVPDLTLAAYLTAHSVSELRFEAFAPREALIAAARLVANEPVLGDGGARIAGYFHASAPSGVHILVHGNRSDGHSTGESAQEVQLLRSRFSTPAGEGGAPRHLTPDAIPKVAYGLELGTVTPGALTPVSAAGEDPYDYLESARTADAVGRALDELLRRAQRAVLDGDSATVFAIMLAIVTREMATKAAELRTPYVVALKRLLHRDFVLALARHLASHRELQDQVLTIFARLGEDGAVLLVEELGESEQRFERRAIFDILARLKVGHSALRHALRDPRWFVVRNAVELLGEIRAPGVASELADLLTHQDPRVRKAVALALGEFREERSATPPLLLALADKNEQVRAAAAASLGGRQGARILESLLNALDSEGDPLVQVVLLDALGRNGTPTAVQRLVEAAEPAGLLGRRKSSEYRAAATAALRTVDSPVARAALKTLRSDKDPAVRGAAGAG